jgi:uncharacterized protein YfaS (alpha-2-macroglobulin family)
VATVELRKNIAAVGRYGVAILATVFALGAALSCRVTEEDRRLWLYSSRAFYPGDEVTVELEGRGLEEVEMAVYPLDLAAAAEHPDLDLHSLSGIDFTGVNPIATWGEEFESRDYWNYKTVSVPVKEEGAYLVKASAKGNVATALVVVTRIALVVKTDNDSLVAYAAERMSGEPVAGVEILTFPRVAEDLVTDADGLAAKDGIVLPEDDSSLTVLGRKGSDVALCDAYFGYYTGERYKGYTYTDRPVYRPAQTVHMKGILRHYVGDEYRNLPDEEVKVEVNAPSGDTAFKAELTTSAFGSFAAEFTLGEEPPLGRYHVNTRFRDQQFTSYFDVEEYRKPEYEVAVTTHKDYYLVGDVLVFDVTGRYYFGEPVARADVDYTVYRRAKYEYGWRTYRYSWYYDYGDYYDYYGWEHVTAGEGQLDDDGHFRGTLALADELSHDYEYRIDAVMTDASRREVTGSAQVPVWRAGLALYAYPDKYFYGPGDAAVITFQSRDPLGRPYPTDVLFEITTERWVESKATGRGKWVEEMVTRDEVSIGPSGEGRYRFVPDENGYYAVNAKAFDEAGNETAYTASFYVADESYYHSYYSGSGVTLTLDKDTYRVGDVALVMVQTDRPGAAALLSVEGDELYHAEVVRPRGNTALVKVPIEGRFTPNVYLAAHVVADDSYSNAAADVVVPPEDRFLRVDIKPDKETYEPREAATFAVEATDWRGKPVAAEVSLGVADESVYAIKPEAAPDIRQFFYDRRGNYVSTNTSFYFYSYGYGEIGGMGGGVELDEMTPAEAPVAAPTAVKAERAKGAGGDYVEPVIRAYFPDTAFWGPQLVTDRSGKASAAFDMPDSLTTWRATARAVTKDTLVGGATAKVIVRKDLLIRLETPRTLTQWDDVVISGVVHNYLPSAQRVKVELQAGPEIKVKGKAVSEITITADGEARVDWPCFVEGVGETTFTAKALTRVESDAMELTIPILPHGLEYNLASARAESASFREVVAVPDDAVAGATVLEISLAPSLAGTMLDALAYLAGYPYGCVEQTMSRFLPTVYVAQTLQKLGLENEELEAELPKMVKAGVERLYNFQHGDGGWGWWTDDETHPYMTAYVCYGLLKAREADFDVRDDVLGKGLKSLADQLDGAKGDKGSTYLYMLYVLAEAQRDEGARELVDAFKKRNKSDAYELSLLALALAKRGMTSKAQVALDDLDEIAVEEGAFVHFTGVGEWHYSWHDSPIQATATALRAIVATRGGDDEKLEGIVRWLALKRRGNYWRSTQETAAVVFALSDYLAVTGELEGDYVAHVLVNGAEAGTLRVTPENVAAAKLHLYLKDKEGAVKAGDNDVQVQVDGTGKVYYSTLLTYYKQEDEISPVDEGFAVSRKYYRLAKGGTEAVEGIPDVVKSGDRFRVDVTFGVARPMEYVILEDYFPSGFEVDEEALAREYYYDWYQRNFYRERRDEKMVFFFTELSAGEYTVSYVIRAEQPGRHLALPAKASLMYAPEVWGSSGEASFNVLLEKRG